MIINDDEAAKRLDSPMNLINRLRTANGSRNSAMSLFGVSKNGNSKETIKEVKTEEVKISFNPFVKVSEALVPITPQRPETPPLSTPAKQEPSIDNLLQNSDTQIKLSLAHDKALDLLNASVEALSAKLDDVSAAKLPAVITATSKVVESIRKERSEAAKSDRGREVHYHFYTPVQKKIEEFEVIEVG